MCHQRWRPSAPNVGNFTQLSEFLHWCWSVLPKLLATVLWLSADCFCKLYHSESSIRNNNMGSALENDGQDYLYSNCSGKWLEIRRQNSHSAHPAVHWQYVAEPHPVGKMFFSKILGGHGDKDQLAAFELCMEIVPHLLRLSCTLMMLPGWIVEKYFYRFSGTLCQHPLNRVNVFWCPCCLSYWMTYAKFCIANSTVSVVQDEYWSSLFKIIEIFIMSHCNLY